MKYYKQKQPLYVRVLNQFQADMTNSNLNIYKQTIKSMKSIEIYETKENFKRMMKQIHKY